MGRLCLDPLVRGIFEWFENIDGVVTGFDPMVLGCGFDDVAFAEEGEDASDLRGGAITQASGSTRCSSIFVTLSIETKRPSL